MGENGELVYTNAQIVTRDSIIEGTVWVANGTIRAVGTGGTSVPSKIDFEEYRQFHRDKKWTDEEFEKSIADRIAIQQRCAVDNRRRILEICRSRQMPLASHDDTTEAHSVESARDGIGISEFPTTLTAARKAQALGMRVIMGAPNLVRGKSHSGNVSASELTENQLLDALSSDYYPLSLLHGAFLLNQRHGLPLPDAVAKVSANIADYLNLHDRGEIAPGKRADLIRVKLCGILPVVLASGRTAKALFQAAEGFARKRQAFYLPPLIPDVLDGFIALIPKDPCPEMQQLADDCVRFFDPFRAPSPVKEMDRRRANGLTDSQEAHLIRWGYPYVMSDFRFHLTLTGRIQDISERKMLLAAVSEAFRPFEKERVFIDAICLFHQAGAEEPFQIARSYPFWGIAASFSSR